MAMSLLDESLTISICRGIERMELFFWNYWKA